MAEQLILDLVINGEGANSSITSMKKEIKELQGLMSNLDPNTEEFKKAASRAAELRDNIDDVNESVASMRGSENSIEGVTSAFGRMQDKVQNLDFDGVGKELNNMSMSLNNFNPQAFLSGIGSMVAGLGKLAGAILTNPIFILAATVAAVGFALYNLATEETQAEKQLKQLTETTREFHTQVVLEEQGLNKAYEAIKNTAAGTKERVTAVKELESKYPNYLTNLDLERANLDQINIAQGESIRLLRASIAEKLKAKNAEEIMGKAVEDSTEYIVSMQNKLKSLGLTQEEQAKFMSTFMTSINAGKGSITGFEKAWAEYSKSVEEAKNVTYEWEKGNINAADILNNLTEEEKKLAQQNATTTSEIENGTNAALTYNTAYETLNDTMYKIDIGMSNANAELEAVNSSLDYYTDVSDIAVKTTEKVTATTIKNNDTKKIEVETIDKLISKYYDLYKAVTQVETLPSPDLTPDPTTYAQDILSWDETNKTKLWLLKEGHKAGLIAEKEYKDARNAIWSEDLENYRAVNDTMGNISSSFFEFLGNLSEGNAKRQKKIAKVAFGVNKATSAIETAINTSQAIMKISATTPPPFSIPLQILTGIQGAAQIAAILSKKFPENGESSNSSVSSISAAATTATPSNQTLFSSGGGTPSNITPFANQQLNQRVYVLESDITSTQANVQKVQVQSTF